MRSKSALCETYDVLLVEDNKDDASLVEHTLRATRDGVRFAVRRAATLDDAIGAMWSDAPDVVLLDLSLPDSVGLQTLELMRVASPTTALVVFTGMADEDAGVQAVSLGAQDYLIKGAAGPTVVRALRHAVARQRRLQPAHGGPLWSSFRATHDAVTGLPNRYLFLDRLQHATMAARRYTEALGLLTIRVWTCADGDADMPPEHYEALAAEISRRLETCTRKSDTVARIEQDVYAIILERARSHSAVRLHVSEMLHRVESPVYWTQHRLTVRIQSGLAFFPNDTGDADGLLAAALRDGVPQHA